MSFTNEGYYIDFHPLVQSTVFERVQFQLEDLRCRLARLSNHLMSLLPSTDHDIMRCLKSDDLLSLVPHLYATADKVVASSLSKESGSLLTLACWACLLLQHGGNAVDLCHQHFKLFSISEDPKQRFDAFYYMGRAYELLSNLQAASHFRNALSVIDNCSSDEKKKMYHENGLVLGQLAACC